MKMTVIFIFLFVLAQFGFGQDLEKVLDFKEKDPITFGGSISGRAGLSGISNIEDRTSPYYYSLTAKMNLGFYGVNLPMYFSLRDNSFHYGKTLPRFRFSPSYKWARLDLGTVYAKFNPYVLNQRNIRGASLKLNPGKLNFQVIYGKMKDFNSFQDTLLLGTVEQESYSQKVLATSIGYGRLSNRVDLYLLKSWDDQDSVFYTQRNVTPQSNLVIGSSAKLRILKRFFLKTNIGLSALTSDVNGIGNERVIGSNPLTEDLLTINATSGFSYAWDAALTYRKGILGLNTKVTYVQPYYAPLTIAFLNTNIFNYTFGTNLRLLNRRLFLNGNIGFQNNNVNGVNANTTNRVIMNLLARLKVTKQVGATVNYSNFSQDFVAKLVNINELYTYAVDNNNQSLTLDYRSAPGSRVYSSAISGGRNTFTTISDLESNSSEYSSKFAKVSFGLKMTDKDLSIRSSLNYRTYDSRNVNSTNYGVSLNVKKGLWDDQLNLMLGNTFSLIDQADAREGSNILTTIGATYKAGPKTSCQFNLSRIQRKSYIAADFTEYRSQVVVSQKF